MTIAASCQTELHKALDLRGNGQLSKETDKVLDVEAVKKIIEGADKAFLDKQNSVGQTALHMMAKFNEKKIDEILAKKEIARLLLAAGASTEVVDNHGCTPMHIACMTAEPMGGITDQLCAAGAKIMDPEKMFGYTPLHWAAASGLPDVIRPLLTHPDIKAALQIPATDGKTPLEIAQAKADAKPYPWKSSLDIVKLIKALK